MIKWAMIELLDGPLGSQMLPSCNGPSSLSHPIYLMILVLGISLLSYFVFLCYVVDLLLNTMSILNHVTIRSELPRSRTASSPSGSKIAGIIDSLLKA